METQEFEEDIDDVLGVGVFEQPEHHSVDGLNEVVGLVLDVPGPQFLVNFQLVLVLVN